MKSFEQLRDEQFALPPLVPVLREELRAIPGVVGVGIGFRLRKGQRTDEIAFTVTVDRKRPLHELSRAHRIPAVVDGVRVDVRQRVQWTTTTDFLDESELDKELNPIRGGASIIHQHDAATQGGIDRGTLGCFAKLRSDPAVIVLLTVHHALYRHATDHGPGLLVGQPRVSSTRCCKSHVIAKTLDGVRGPIADAAIAKLLGKRPFVQLLPGIGRDKNGRNEDLIVGVPDEITVGGIKTAVLCGETVRKLGRNTGVTHGEVLSIDAAIGSTDQVTGESTDYEHQIIIQPTKGGVDDNGQLNFCVAGDSGSVVINQFNQVIGLLHTAGPMTQAELEASSVPCAGATVSPNVANLGGAAPIHAILDALGIDIFPSPGVNSTGIPTSPPSPAIPTGALVPGSGLQPRMMTAEELVRSRVLDVVIDELFSTPLGRKILALYEQHGPQARELLEHDRRVKIAWHRNHGPTFVAKLMSGLSSPDHAIPAVINGVPALEALQRVVDVFLERGTESFAADGRRYMPLAFELLGGALTLRDALDRVREYRGEL